MLAAAIGLWLALIAARGTPIGAAMRRWLVEAPARRLSQVKRGNILLMLTLVGIAVATVWLLDNDGRMLVAFGLPDLATMAIAIDLGTLLDATLVAVAAASAVRFRDIGARLRRPSPRRPRTRSIRVRRATPPANNDDEGRPALAA